MLFMVLDIVVLLTIITTNGSIIHYYPIIITITNNGTFIHYH